MDESRDFLAKQGARALATRLRRLYETLGGSVASAYREAGIKFEPRWFGLVALLRSQPDIEISEAAIILGQSHVAVVQVTNVLEKHGLVRRTDFRADKRRRTLALTKKGKALCETLDPFWDSVRIATHELLVAAAPHFLEELTTLEAALAKTPLQVRIRESQSKRNQRP